MKWKHLAASVAVGLLIMATSATLVAYRLDISDSGCRDWAAEFSQSSRFLRDCTDPKARYYALAEAAKAAATVQQYHAAFRFAEEGLRLAPLFRHDWNYGNVIHDAHMVLGRVAVSRGDLSAAGAELLAAGATPGSPQLDSFGPNMALASDLLRAGQRQVVLQYFDQCGRFWVLGNRQLRRWRFLVRVHLPPDFGANLLF